MKVAHKPTLVQPSPNAFWRVIFYHNGEMSHRRLHITVRLGVDATLTAGPGDDM